MMVSFTFRVFKQEEIVMGICPWLFWLRVIITTKIVSVLPIAFPLHEVVESLFRVSRNDKVSRMGWQVRLVRGNQNIKIHRDQREEYNDSGRAFKVIRHVSNAVIVTVPPPKQPNVALPGPGGRSSTSIDETANFPGRGNFTETSEPNFQKTRWSSCPTAAQLRGIFEPSRDIIPVVGIYSSVIAIHLHNQYEL